MRYEVKINNERLKGPSYFVVDTQYGYDVVATFFQREHADQFVWLLNHKEQMLEKFFADVSNDIQNKFEKK